MKPHANPQECEIMQLFLTSLQQEFGERMAELSGPSQVCMRGLENRHLLLLYSKGAAARCAWTGGC